MLKERTEEEISTQLVTHPRRKFEGRLEAGVTVVFHVLLVSNFKMEEECLHIRASGDDLGSFKINCVDLEFVE